MLRWLNYLFQEYTPAIKHENSSSKHLGQQKKQQHHNPHNLLIKTVVWNVNVILFDHNMFNFQQTFDGQNAAEVHVYQWESTWCTSPGFATA